MHRQTVRRIGTFITIIVCSAVVPSLFSSLESAVTPHFDPVAFGLPADAKEVVKRRTEKAITFEITPGKFASVSTGDRLESPSCDRATLATLCRIVTHVRGFVPSAFATSAGPNSPGTVVSVETGWGDWVNPGNATASDDVYATFSSGTSSDQLQATSFGFAIPSGGIIDGIVAEFEKVCTHTTQCTDSQVKIVKGGVLGSTNKGKGLTEWGTTELYDSYGANNDLWGETWTSTDINDAGFGCSMSAGRYLGRTLSVDHIRITVYYTEAAGVAPFFSWWSLPLMLLGCGWVLWKEGYLGGDIVHE